MRGRGGAFSLLNGGIDMSRTVRLGSLAVLALALPALAADTYDVDKEHASVVFKVRHLGMSDTWGRFNDVAGTLVIDDQDPSKSTFSIVIKTESVDTGNERRDRHLRNADFFDAGQFPEITFRSKTVRRPEPSAWEVAGDLSLHGVTKPVTLRINKIGQGQDPWGKTRIGGELTLTIKRSEFGMTNMQQAVGDEVTLFVSLEGIKK